MHNINMNKKHKHTKQAKKPFGFNIIGYVSRSQGLSIITRNLIRLLLNKHYPVAIYDFNPPESFTKQDDLSYSKYFVKSISKLPFSINIFTLPIRDATLFLFSDQAQLFKRSNTLNVFCPMWELTVLPAVWIKAVQLCDLIITHSKFIRFTCERYLPTMPMVSAGNPLYFPSNIKSCRSRFDLTENAVIFVNSFDTQSDPARKNPIAVIRAFKKAFKNSSRERLVIKVHNAVIKGVTCSIVEELTKISDIDNRIKIITEELSYFEILSLYASCDIFVSLHRSEGLGLALMEAMKLGKPVIATGWSGNMSFMSYRNSFPVRYKLVPAKGSVKWYNNQFIGKNAFWAEPDIEDAALWMCRLANDENLRYRIGKKAAQDMEVFQKQAKKGAFLEDILAIWEKQCFNQRTSKRLKNDKKS